MALTDTEKAKIRMYLGWPDRFHQTDSRLERAFNALDSNISSGNTATYVLIQGELTTLATTETSLSDAHSRLKARQVGSIELPRFDEIAILRSEGRRSIGRIASLLGVEVRHDAFSGSGPRHHATYGGPSYDSPTGSNEMLHG